VESLPQGDEPCSLANAPASAAADSSPLLRGIAAPALPEDALLPEFSDEDSAALQLELNSADLETTSLPDDAQLDAEVEPETVLEVSEKL